MTPSLPPRLVLFARFPTPGAAKTRLIPAIGKDGAANVHRQLTERTVRILESSGAPVELRYTGATASDFRDWLGPGITLVEQVAGDLSARLLASIEPAPVIFFGADTPDLQIGHVSQAIQALETKKVVIGPARDGGYYLIGIAERMDWLFESMPWSTDQVMPETLSRLRDRSIQPVLLEPLDDCDRPEDLTNWTWLGK